MFPKHSVKLKNAFSVQLSFPTFPYHRLDLGRASNGAFLPKYGKGNADFMKTAQPWITSGCKFDDALWKHYEAKGRSKTSQLCHRLEPTTAQVKAGEVVKQRKFDVWNVNEPLWRKGLPEASQSGESQQQPEYLKSSSIFALFLLFLCASEEEGCLPERGEKAETGERGLSSLLGYVRSLFVVSAAKPYEDNGEVIKSGKKDPPLGGKRHSLNFIADVLEAVQGAVVCIEVQDHSTVNWFGMPQSSSNGSGFILKEDGLILTNAHVVASSQRCSISVKLHDGRCFAGYVEDVDYESDLATVRVKARGLPTLQLGCSANTRLGEWVVAVGSPLNLSNTVTAGIVSSTSRGANELGIHANDINYIQTDAAITFGNSGGPLINLDGEVIGINSMKVTPGISFAIPIDHAKFLEIAELRRAKGAKDKLIRRYMGLTILSLTDEIRTELEIRTGVAVDSQGVFVWQVVRGGPAFLAGLQPGDVITNINGIQISSAAQVHEIVKSDYKLVVKVQRGDSNYTFTVVPENVNCKMSLI